MPEKTPEQFQREARRLEARLPEARAELMRIPGVVDVSPGIRERGGMATDEVVFHVMVEWKKPLAEIPPEHRIPPVVAGFPTDVIQVHGEVPEDEVLAGGMALTQGGTGTLGAVALATAANTRVPENTPLLLTNNHVAPRNGGLVGIGSVCDSLCCECCDVGRVVDTQITAAVDAAIASLNAGVRFTHEVIGIGPVRGRGVAVLGTPIIKYGNTTKLTNGVVTNPAFTVTRNDGNTLTGQIRVGPVPPTTDMSEGGDSGSVYIDPTTRSVVGLHHSGPQGGPTSTGNHIGPVAALLNIDFPVMDTPGAIPLSGVGFEPARPTILDAVSRLRSELDRTEAGRRWLELMRTHAREVRDLVNHDRATQLAWQRHQGPAFVAHFVKSAREPSHRVPRELGGIRIENLILAMASTLQRSGSPELVAAITEHYLTVLQFAIEHDSVDALVGRARDYAVHAGAPLTSVRR